MGSINYDTKTVISEALTRAGLNSTDTGSPEAQISLFSHKISHLTKHCQQHKKDKSTLKGLLAYVEKRRKMLRYLKRLSLDRYQKLVEALGIRH